VVNIFTAGFRTAVRCSRLALGKPQTTRVRGAAEIGENSHSIFFSATDKDLQLL
jgi:hypothetical protein